MKTRLYTTLLLLLLYWPAAAQDAGTDSAVLAGEVRASLVVDNETPFIGQPITMTFVVNAPPGTAVTAWPQFPPGQVFDVLETGEPSTAEYSDHVTHQQRLQIALWQTGAHLTPELFVGYRLADGREGQAPVTSAYIEVRSVLNPPDVALRPLKPLQRLPHTPLWVYALAVTGAAVVPLFGRWWLLRRRWRARNGSQQGSPAQVAILSLRALQERGLPAVEVYARTAEHLRRYLLERFEVRAGEMTTRELLRALDREGLSQGELQQLQQILEQADLVKFAGFEPGSGSERRLVAVAIRWLESVEQTSRQYD